MGRPSTYTEEIAQTICRRLAEGESLRSICRDDAMPSWCAVRRWLQTNESFQAQYARARDEQADTHADEIIDIADQATDRDSAAAAKVRVDARKWVAAKLKPRKYGDRQIVEVGSVDDAATIVERVRALLGGSVPGASATLLEMHEVNLVSGEPVEGASALTATMRELA